jgi:hypothetical protein
MTKKSTQSQIFCATLEQGSLALGWVIARVPFDPAAVWPKMIRQRVRGEINGFAFRTSLFPDPRGGSYLLINRVMQKAVGAHLGDTAEFRLEPDLEERAAELPDELAVLLEDEPGLRPWYDSLTEYTRREIGKWILAVKTDASRLKRAEQMAERLLATMEAEDELPPIIFAALRPEGPRCLGNANSSATPAATPGHLLLSDTGSPRATRRKTYRHVTGKRWQEKFLG